MRSGVSARFKAHRWLCADMGADFESMGTRYKPGAQVQLTNTEKEMLRRIQFDLDQISDREQAKSNWEGARNLTLSLLKRVAIPEIRLRYFTKPEFCTARGKKSHKEIFEANGTRGNEIFEHPHFLKFLRYFIYGPDLPAATIKGFCDFMRKEVSISGSTDKLRNLTRKEMRCHGLDRNYAPEEFFKLAIEAGFDLHSANSIRRAAMEKVKWRPS